MGSERGGGIWDMRCGMRDVGCGMRARVGLIKGRVEGMGTVPGMGVRGGAWTRGAPGGWSRGWGGGLMMGGFGTEEGMIHES